jgi:hypothetical protein
MLNKVVMNLHKVVLIVSIPEEHWEEFRKSIKETGDVQFEYRGVTIFAEMF